MLHEISPLVKKKNAQLEKEALARVYRIIKFHKYLNGREFILQTDHKPLIGLLKEDRAISVMSRAIIQRWALTMSKKKKKKNKFICFTPNTTIQLC